MSDRRYTDTELCKRLFLEARPYWWHLAAIFFLGLLSTPLALLTPVPLKIAVDSVIGSEPFPALLETLTPTGFSRSTSEMIAVSCLLLAIGLLTHLRSLAAWVLDTYVGEKLVLDFRSKIFQHLQRLSLVYHDTIGTTDSVYRIQYDAPSVRLFANYSLIPLVTSCIMLVSMLWVTAVINWELAIASLAVCPILYVLTNISRKRVRGSWSEVKRHESSAMAVVQEVLSAIRTVKAFTKEEREHSRFLDSSKRSVSRKVKIAFTVGSFDSLIALTIVAGEAAVLFIGVQLVKTNSLSLGDLLIVMAYLAQLYQPLKSISKNVTDLQSALASADRVYPLLDEDFEVLEAPNARSFHDRAKGHIRFENVIFSYGRKTPVLDNISFDIRAGTRIGLTGATGAGKTTLVSLLARFYDPSHGRIYLDEIDLSEYKLTDLRKQISFVLQDTVLFSASVRENIAYAKPEAPEEEIIAAAKAANAHDFIMSLPHQYETLVGEKGMLLSGGQRQRISLARAFLKDAPIIVLDEPTSALDVQTESEIMNAMQRLMAGRTTIMITHRPKTLDQFNFHLHLENGKIFDQSQHAYKGFAPKKPGELSGKSKIQHAF